MASQLFQKSNPTTIRQPLNPTKERHRRRRHAAGYLYNREPAPSLSWMRCGSPEEKGEPRLVQGVAAGIAAMARWEYPLWGDVYFHPSYRGNPLVNAMAVGVLRQSDLVKAAAAIPGSTVMVAGSRTSRDGIHGATFASAELGEGSEEKVTAVQAGDPFMENLLMEACLEVIQKGLLAGIQDMGAAGLHQLVGGDGKPRQHRH